MITPRIVPEIEEISLQESFGVELWGGDGGGDIRNTEWIPMEGYSDETLGLLFYESFMRL